MIRSLVLILLLSTPVSADTASVTSGEHGDFTRLVIDLPGEGGWTLGRTATGYAFAAVGDNPPDYDLSGVWDLITRTRLAAVRTDSMAGALALDLACDCHIFPFEISPDVVVLDIKPGPPPPASAFEATFAVPGAVTPTVGTASGTRYDWLLDRATAGNTATAEVPMMALPLKTGSVSLDPLRDALLEEIARGAVDGIVEMELPDEPPDAPDTNHKDLPWSNIHLGDTPGLVVIDPDALVPGARPDGACIDPAVLDLPVWGADKSAEDLLIESRTGLYGEFDAPDLAAIRRATQQLLFLGFGAEARQTANLAGPEVSDDLKVYRSMGTILDGDSDPNTPFADMLDCDGPAALWAALARDRLPPGPGLRRDAIVQSFVALPPHLRQHLGPRLAKQFLALDDAGSARMIRDAMERAPDADRVAVALLDARTDLHLDDPAAARSHAKTAVAMDGDGPDGLVTLVETHFQTLEPLGPEIAEALLSLQRETRGTETGPAVDRGVVLALALSNQFDAAFAAAPGRDPVLSDLWRVTEDRATDDEFLRNAVLPAGASPPRVTPELGMEIAERLLSLGFPDAAHTWVGPVFPEDPSQKRKLAAQMAFLQGDARAAIGYLDGLNGNDAAALRAKALIQLDDIVRAAQALVLAGEPEAAVRLGPWTGNWSGLDPALPESWLTVAKTMTGSGADESSGLLGRGAAAVAASDDSRAAIEALLTSVASPDAE